MLAIRLQRTGRSGHAQFRVIVQDSRRSPKSGVVVAYLGSYDPHAKKTTLVKDNAEFYLKNGAQPSSRIAGLLKKEGIKLPGWVEIEGKKKRSIRNPEKLRKNRPAGAPPPPKKEEAKEAEAEEKADEPETTPEAATDQNEAAADDKEEKAPQEAAKPVESPETTPEAPESEASEKPKEKAD